MHNRDMIWRTADGKKIKLKDMSSSHLTNVQKHINTRLNAYILKFGKSRIDDTLFNIKQEIRLRKLNRLNSENDELF